MDESRSEQPRSEDAPPRPKSGEGSLVADEPAPDPRLEREQEGRRRPTAVLGLFALGIVYGDIGTSPIYAFRESLRSVGPSPENVLGILSLVFWSLGLVVSLKYLFYVLRADNDGEGGILALVALLDPWRKGRRVLVFLGLFGAALLYGDGMITPAISVLSAVEGLEVAAPSTAGWVLPVAVAILVSLFLIQRRGTTGIGRLFGPVMAIWFVTLAVLGIAAIARAPGVLAAANPTYAVRFLLEHGVGSLAVLGAVFLVVTGGEAMYADLGHFGTRPIRLGWFVVVLPALLLNYFGQGALLLGDAAAARQPFYALAPTWALYPLVGLTTIATIIASQAVISGVYSLTRQAIHLGQCPPFRVQQTSEEDIGRVYVPAVNWMMMLATIGLVLGFRSSGALASAYGVAVSTTFVITTLLMYRVAREGWGWRPAVALPVTAVFLGVDLIFFGANLTKIREGGWFPLTIAVLVWLLMSTWWKGNHLIDETDRAGNGSMDDLLGEIRADPPPRVPGTGVFLTRERQEVPPTLRRHLDRNRALHETVLLFTVLTSNVPRVPFGDRIETEEVGEGIYRVSAHYGFMQSPRIPVIVEALGRAGLPVGEKGEVTYYVGRRSPIPVVRPEMRRWRVRIFEFLSRNAPHAEAEFRIPPENLVELGMPVEI